MLPNWIRQASLQLLDFNSALGVWILLHTHVLGTHRANYNSGARNDFVEWDYDLVGNLRSTNWWPIDTDLEANHPSPQ